MNSKLVNLSRNLVQKQHILGRKFASDNLFFNAATVSGLGETIKGEVLDNAVDLKTVRPVS
jgi:hypothetical protein